MPYSEPPAKVKDMPKHAQEIWTAAFNAALKEYDDEGKANATAYAAVKAAGYEQDEKGEWHKRGLDVQSLWESVKRLFAPLIDLPGKENEYQVSLPTITRSLVVTRSIDGAPRWLMIAASAVINKVGAIDSTTLFDNFIRRAHITTQYPVLDFYHEGEHIRFGIADWLCRDGALYLASGTFDDTDLARAAAAGLESQADYWGASIAYRITIPPLMLINEGEIPVYVDGINNFISIVPKRLAANLFTATSVSKEVIRMNKSEFDELVKLVGAERAAQFAEDVDDTNRTITEACMVMRAEELPQVHLPIIEERVEERPPEPSQPDAPAAEPTMAEIVTKINELEARLSKLEQGNAGAVEESARIQQRATDATNDLVTRLAAVEESKTRWDNWLADAPEHIKKEFEIVRARNQPTAPPTMEQVAAMTTAKMKRRPQ